MGAIYGVYCFDKGRPVSREALTRMASVMAHRGATSVIHIDGNVGLGYSTMHPLEQRNPGGAAGLPDARWAVLDGAIYNWVSMANDLEKRGLVIPGCGRSELIRAYYRAMSLEFPKSLDGVFALALWDGQEERLVLARDPFGAKPLYYKEDKDGVTFGSEAKAIIAASCEKPKVNRDALFEYLTFRYVSGDATLFSGIRELPPGRCLSWRGADRKERTFWSPDVTVLHPDRRNLDENVDQLDTLLRNSIAKRTMGAGRIGANCSGGIDSGIVTALATVVTEKPIDSFTLGFEEKDWDERPRAKWIADKYRTRAHEIVVTSRHFSELLPKLNWHNDNPLSDPNSVLVYVLASQSKDIVDLLLTGEGADEVFLGYPRYNLLKAYGLLKRLPRPLKEALASALAFTGRRKMRKLGATLAMDQKEAVIRNSSFVPADLVGSVLRREHTVRAFADRSDRVEQLGNLDLLSAVMLYEIGTYMVSSLNRLDRMSMAAGVEADLPFLDRELFEFALGVPWQQKISWVDNKIILRRLASRYLPARNLAMPKSGFGVPIAAWFRTEVRLKEILGDLQSDGAVGEFFERKNMNAVISAHRRGESDFSEILWLMVSFFLWHQQFC